MSKPIEAQYSYKKVIALTEQQHKSLDVLSKYVNVSQFIRAAIKEKLHNEWPIIRERKSACPF